MLVMSRAKNESLVINHHVVITVIEIRGDKVRLGVQCPREYSVHRQEVYEAIQHYHTEPASSEFSPTNWYSPPAAPATPAPVVSPSTVDASSLRIDRERPLESLKAHLRTVLGESSYRQIQPLLDQLQQSTGISVP